MGIITIYGDDDLVQSDPAVRSMDNIVGVNCYSSESSKGLTGSLLADMFSDE
jgi:hypothetical protein